MSAVRAAEAAAGGAVARGLTASALRVRLGGRDVVDDVGLELAPGTVTALVGPNGAGKSTLLRVLAGVDRPSAGTVRLGGADLLALPRRERARRVAFVEQDARTDAPLTVREAVALGRIPHGSLFGPEGPADAAAVGAALGAADVARFAGRRLATLSGGERQRVHVARALAQEPELLLLDEPTNHLDVRAQLELLALLQRLAYDRGLTVLAALHDLNSALSAADAVVVLHDGRVVAAGAPDAVLTPALLDRVYGVTAREVGGLLAFALPGGGA